MKTIFAKNRVTFQVGNGTAYLAPSKVAEIVVEAVKDRKIEPALPIYFGNERKHSGVYE